MANIIHSFYKVAPITCSTKMASSDHSLYNPCSVSRNCSEQKFSLIEFIEAEHKPSSASPSVSDWLMDALGLLAPLQRVFERCWCLVRSFV